MGTCRYCLTEAPDRATRCPGCGQQTGAGVPPVNKPLPILPVIGGVLVLVGTVGFFGLLASLSSDSYDVAPLLQWTAVMSAVAVIGIGAVALAVDRRLGHNDSR